MSKFLSWNFLFLIVLVLVLFIVHEFGHYLSYRILGYQATVRKSLIAPGIDPKETIEIPNWQGIFIAVSGFALSTITIVLSLYLMNYKYWFVLLIGSIAGSIVDAVWAISMLFKKTVTIHSR